MIRRVLSLALLAAGAVYAPACTSPKDDFVAPPTVVPTEVHLGGGVQKGPFILGSTVALWPVDAAGNPSGLYFSTQTADDLGQFSLTFAYQGGVSIEADGYYYNEVLGQLSAAPLTLRALTEVTTASEQAVYVNLFTHLANQRERTLMQQGVSLPEAVAQAETELIAALPITAPATAAAGVAMNILGGDNEANAYLLAVSAMMAQGALRRGGPPDAALQELVNSVSQDLADDGQLEPTLRDFFAESLASLDASAIMTRLAARLAALGLVTTVPDIHPFVPATGDCVSTCTAGTAPTCRDGDTLVRCELIGACWQEVFSYACSTWTSLCHPAGGCGLLTSPEVQEAGVVFRYKDRGATSVEVTGDFTTPPFAAFIALEKKSGYFESAPIAIADGTHQYKLRINGTLLTFDPASLSKVTDGAGGFNSIVTVGETTPTEACASAGATRCSVDLTREERCSEQPDSSIRWQGQPCATAPQQYCIAPVSRCAALPIIDGTQATFYFASDTATAVELTGSFSDPQWQALPMAKVAGTSYFSTTVTGLSPGTVYAYKFVVGGLHVADDLNPNRDPATGNSRFTVPCDASCSGCVNDCPTAGATQCSGSVVQTCAVSTDGCRKWVSGTDCMSTAQACDDTSGIAECSDTCVDRCPALGDTRCVDDAVESCVSGSSGCLDWVMTASCVSSGKTCQMVGSAAACVTSCHECATVGATRCLGAVIQTCSAGTGQCRTWTDDVDCSTSGKVCTYPQGEPTCTYSDFREETIYSVITSRFFDGDPSNNYYNRDLVELGDPHWRGDFKGLIQQLDYIKDLGFTAIELTPVVTNRSGLDYHGYHAYDFTAVDPRYESTGATYQDLINEAHNRGIKIIQDIVINHSSNYGIRNKVHIARAPIKYFREAGKVPTTDPAQPYQTNIGDYRSPSREDCDNPLAPDVFRTPSDPAGNGPITCPVCGGTIQSTYSGTTNHAPGHFFNPPSADNSVGHLDSTWYHQAGYMAGGDWETPASLQQKHMAGDCMDLNTENATVKEYLMSAYDRYLDMGVDAFRVDTVKHIERSNLLEYINHFKAHKPGVFIFGENLVKGTGWGSECDYDNASMVMRPWYYTTTYSGGGCPGGQVEDSGFAVLDFSLFSTFRNNLSNGNYDGIAGIFGHDHLYGDATKLVTFLDNHDVGPDNEWKSRFKGSNQQLAAALNLLWTARGIPSLFYGTEARFKSAGEPIEPSWNGGRLSLSQSGRAYFGDALTPANIAATKSHPIYQHIKRLNAIRRAIPALQKGSMEQYGGGGGSFYIVRNYNNGESYAVVGLSQGGDSFTVSGVRNGTYKDAVTGNTITVANGTLSFGVGAGSAGIYVKDGPGKIGVDGTWLR